MKKNILILVIGIIIGTTITAGATYVYRASDIGYSPTDENWNVTNANEAISSLKTDVNSLNEYRSDIVESLVDKGVEVNENSSMADIKNGIEELGTTYSTVIMPERGELVMDRDYKQLIIQSYATSNNRQFSFIYNGVTYEAIVNKIGGIYLHTFFIPNVKAGTTLIPPNNEYYYLILQ